MWPQRLAFIFLAAFCVVMNTLVWRIHYGGGAEPGGEAELETVWRMLLEAPDTSDLEIRRHGQRIGYARWMPRILETPSETNLEGMVRAARGYALDVDGNFALPGHPARHRFTLQLRLNPALEWRTLQFRFILKPHIIDLEADAEARTLSIHYKGADNAFRREFTFDALANPEAFLEEAGLGWARESLPLTLALAPLGLDGRPAETARFETRAYMDRLRIGRASARGYRIVVNRGDLRLDAAVNRAGELFKVDLPWDVTLVNEAIAARNPKPATAND